MKNGCTQTENHGDWSYVYVSSINMFNKGKHGMQMRQNNQNDQEVKMYGSALHID